MSPEMLAFDADTGPEDDSGLLRDLRQVAGRSCAGCGGRCTAYEAVWSIAVGLKNAPRCLPCLGHGLGRDTDDLLAQLTDYVQRRDCYGLAWREAERLEAAECSVPATNHTPAPVGKNHPVGVPTAPMSEWNAGDLGCGDLVMALRVRIAALPLGAVLRVQAADPAAPEDLPAWCRLTGNPLVSADHPIYHIRRKGA